MKIKVAAGFSGKIATGSYENASPSYYAEVEYDVDEVDEVDKEKISELIRLQQLALRDVCFQNFKADEQKLIVERISRERADFRWYGGDKEYPSVTSIIGWDADFHVSPEELQEYASHGNLYHAQIEHYIRSKTWMHPKDIFGTWADLVIVTKGKLGLPLNDWNFPAFLQKYPIEGMQIGVSVISKIHKYGGTPDIIECMYEGKRTLADVKRTPEKVKHFKQTAAYIMALEENGAQPYEQMMLIPASGETQQGFSKPIISVEMNQYKAMFLRDRENFRKRFGI